jgi:hypothetical protein
MPRVRRQAMSYDAARKMFAENVQFVTPPGNDWERMNAYNLNKGLMQLAEALAQDMAHLEGQLAQLRQEVQRLRK